MPISQTALPRRPRKPFDDEAVFPAKNQNVFFARQRSGAFFESARVILQE